jgi:hypothetical protein
MIMYIQGMFSFHLEILASGDTDSYPVAPRIVYMLDHTLYPTSDSELIDLVYDRSFGIFK